MSVALGIDILNKRLKKVVFGRCGMAVYVLGSNIWIYFSWHVDQGVSITNSGDSRRMIIL